MRINRLEPIGASSFMREAPTLAVSLLIPARRSGHSLKATVEEAVRFFAGRVPGDYEIILIPNSRPGDTLDPSGELCEKLAREFPQVRSEPHRALPGKGAALRTGMSRARGRAVFFTDADLPYELEFFDRALARLNEGYALVTGNRRLPTSHFNIPTPLLPIAYGRHRLGLAFNRVVRLFFGVTTTDTQAGIKAMSRELAREAFSRIECPGFFFDLELFLVARSRGFRQIELPVVLFLNTEKSTVRVIREGLLAAYWLTRIFIRRQRGGYAS